MTNKLKESHTHPLAEVFGFPTSDMSLQAKRHRSKRLCPFNNKIPNCTKDKAQDPLGVCSVYEEDGIAITCPIRFRQEWRIADDAADFFFGSTAQWTTLSEVRLKDAEGKSAGNIDIVLCAYDKDDTVYDFGALEIQAVYISGNIRSSFAQYMVDPARRFEMDWRSEPNYPRPDYLSSSRKRLAPQLLFKGGILKVWRKKVAVAMNRGFFQTLPRLTEVDKNEADIAWMVYDLRETNQIHSPLELVRIKTVYTRFGDALSAITNPHPGKVEDFLKHLQSKVDEKLEAPPDNRTVEDPFRR